MNERLVETTRMATGKWLLWCLLRFMIGWCYEEIDNGRFHFGLRRGSLRR